MRSICISPEDNATLCRSYIQLTMSSHIVPRDRFQHVPNSLSKTSRLVSQPVVVSTSQGPQDFVD
ncbi:hypothetical protein CSPX01_12492 [Colletotrichum filicis]|nr:hypothetical protein CSPX01_12492 [Colletotrichum filicis]